MSSVPYIPDSAPFSPEQREWLNGFLAGMFSSAPGGAPTAEPTPSKGRVPVLFGSQSGNAESLAEQFASALITSGFDAPLVNMEEHTHLDLTKEKHLLVVCSTWGDGDPPDNAAEFWETLTSADYPKLSQLRYSVCGLGDTNYLEFCAMGKRFDARLAELGATALVERVDCDVDFEEPANAWFAKVCDVLGSSVSSESAAPAEESLAYGKKNPFPALLKTNRELNHPDSPRDTRHFELSLAGSGLTYEVGDALGVIPENCPEVVDALLAALGYAPDSEVPTPRGEKLPLREAFLSHYAITSPNTKFLKAYEEATGFAPDYDYLWGREIIDLVEEQPSWRPSPESFCALLGKLNPRLYSISSSPKAHKDEVHLTIAAVRYESHGKARRGVCSTFLADRCDGGTAKVFVQTSHGFRLPEDLGTNVIMVGPGTGIAPFRAFLEERIATNAPGQNWLFFGNPHEATDFLYREELTTMSEAGQLHHLDLAWSRDGDQKVYVQDKMREKASTLWEWLESGAHFYVCGDAKRMAKDVDDALHEIIATCGGLGEDGAKAFVSEMKKQKRYQRDVY